MKERARGLLAVGCSSGGGGVVVDGMRCSGPVDTVVQCKWASWRCSVLLEGP